MINQFAEYDHNHNLGDGVDEREKVFCKYCRYLDRDIDSNGNGKECKKNPEAIETPLKMVYNQKRCDDKNKYNNCEDYEHKLTFFEMVYGKRK